MSQIPRSENCKLYTDTVSVLVDGHSHVPGDARCRVEHSSTLSCQTSGFEAPDEITKKRMTETAVKELTGIGCDMTDVKHEFRTMLVGAQNVDYSGEKLSKLGMSSSCYKAGNDPNEATHIIKARCFNQYEMTNSRGERVKDTNKAFYSNLYVCDMSDEADAQLQEDARKVAAYNAAQNGFIADKESDLSCTFSVLPVI